LTGSLKSCLYDTGASRVVLSTSTSKGLYFDQNIWLQGSSRSIELWCRGRHVTMHL